MIHDAEYFVEDFIIESGVFERYHLKNGGDDYE